MQTATHPTDHRSSAPPVARIRGAVKVGGLRKDKGFLFVSVAGIDYFIHKSAVGRFTNGEFETHVPTWNAIAEGSVLEFQVADGGKGPRGAVATLVG